MNANRVECALIEDGVEAGVVGEWKRRRIGLEQRNVTLADEIGRANDGVGRIIKGGEVSVAAVVHIRQRRVIAHSRYENI